MATRKKIIIDRDRCIGCEMCVNACPGGALQMVDGKAAVTREDYCDGLGACIGECPVDAISFEEVEIPTTPATPATTPASPAKTAEEGFVCPSLMNRIFDQDDQDNQASPATPAATDTAQMPSELKAWPIQLHLIRPEAPQFAGADILIAASCTAFTLGSFHADLLKGRALVIACPKLDRTDGYIEKLSDMFSVAAPASITVARMVVPCCGGLIAMAKQARESAGSNLNIREVVISLKGDIISDGVI